MDRKPAAHPVVRTPEGHQPRRRYFLAEPLRHMSPGPDAVVDAQPVSPDIRPLDVLLVGGGQRTPVAGVRDVSLDGIYVYLDPGTVRVGRDVDLILIIDNDGRRAEHRVSATVRRVDSQGAALIFGDYADEMYSDLIALLCAS